MTVLYDPPSGWMYGFPKEYKPLENESLEETLIRDGYPEKDIELAVKYCRFIGKREELDKVMKSQKHEVLT